MARAEARIALQIDEQTVALLLFGTQRADKDFETVIHAAGRVSPPPLLLFVGKHLSGPAPIDLLQKSGFTHFRIEERFVSQEEANLFFAASAVRRPQIGFRNRANDRNPFQ